MFVPPQVQRATPEIKTEVSQMLNPILRSWSSLPRKQQPLPQPTNSSESQNAKPKSSAPLSNQPVQPLHQETIMHGQATPVTSTISFPHQSVQQTPVGSHGQPTTLCLASTVSSCHQPGQSLEQVAGSGHQQTMTSSSNTSLVHLSSQSSQQLHHTTSHGTTSTTSTTTTYRILQIPLTTLQNLQASFRTSSPIIPVLSSQLLQYMYRYLH